MPFLVGLARLPHWLVYLLVLVIRLWYYLFQHLRYHLHRLEKSLACLNLMLESSHGPNFKRNTFCTLKNWTAPLESSNQDRGFSRKGKACQERTLYQTWGNISHHTGNHTASGGMDMTSPFRYNASPSSNTIESSHLQAYHGYHPTKKTMQNVGTHIKDLPHQHEVSNFLAQLAYTKSRSMFSSPRNSSGQVAE